MKNTQLMLTEEEKSLILARRELADKAKPKKTGELKENLYSFNDDDEDKISYGIYTSAEKEKMVASYNSLFNMNLPKGTKFICFIDDDKEKWYSEDNPNVCGANAAWAKKHLINIKEIPNRK